MKIIQLTDFHLFENEKEKIHGYCSYDCLKLVIDYIVTHNFMNADAVLITGDISEDRSSGSYYLALRQLSRMKLPIYEISGNHDNKFIMNSVFMKSSIINHVGNLNIKEWKVFHLETVQDGHDSGLCSMEQLLSIEKNIVKNNITKIALFMHHHPVPVGTPLVDSCMLMNNKDLLRLCEKNNSIKAIACGHAHTDYSEIYNHCIIDVCPATCFQWSKGTTNIKTENIRGFKILEFTENYKSRTFFI